MTSDILKAVHFERRVFYKDARLYFRRVTRDRVTAPGRITHWIITEVDRTKVFPNYREAKNYFLSVLNS